MGANPPLPFLPIHHGLQPPQSRFSDYVAAERRAKWTVCTCCSSDRWQSLALNAKSSALYQSPCCHHCVRVSCRLEILYLGGNRLSSLPAELGHVTSLVSLVLSDNQLTSLPRSLCNLHRLQSLSLHNNQLSTLPPDICRLPLVELSLRNNPLVVRCRYNWHSAGSGGSTLAPGGTGPPNHG